MNKNPITSLDIIIPSFRVNPEFILRIMRLKSPTELSRKIILVIDNPNIEIPSELIELEQNMAILALDSGTDTSNISCKDSMVSQRLC